MAAEDEVGVSEAGIYTWILADDRVFGDTLAAALFGLKAEDAIGGLPLAEFLARIHPDDQGQVVDLISRAVRDGEPYYAEYRVLNAEREPQHVMALGRCFRNESGMPFIYSGIVYPIERLPN
jgi:PAS domain-containing protein